MQLLWKYGYNESKTMNKRNINANKEDEEWILILPLFINWAWEERFCKKRSRVFLINMDD